MSAIYATRFQSRAIRGILIVLEGGTDMSIYQNTNFTHPLASANPLRMVFSIWNDTENRIKERQNLARHERVVAGLPPHLRQPLGEPH